MFTDVIQEKLRFFFGISLQDICHFFSSMRNVTQHKAALFFFFFLTCVRRSVPSAASSANFASLQSTGVCKVKLVRRFLVLLSGLTVLERLKWVTYR